ncbi:hypothetical protein Poly51_50010 [Rubripirellula tenax]|uniref:Uncharacterized protein n=1 Tax=Rubripirellula tenax TaxID=2528015 RepID=A0A5C6EBP7_9BACT|nr:hypothetical protein [Rubripirellula tenax]TWU47203.1 hypothetical protein Poly51_50010 [Rubripirellula tenax]
MVARDDSVIRGSLIACMIFLVLSLALNFFLWRSGNFAAQEAAATDARLQTINSNVRTMESQISRFKGMLGQEPFTQAQIDEMKTGTSEDPVMQAIEEQFTKDMSYFGSEIEPQDRNYPRLPEYLVNAIRDRNINYANARSEATKIRTDAEAEISNAEKSMDLAKQQAADANKKVTVLSTEFDEDRARMNQEKEETRDKLNTTVQDFGRFRSKASEETKKLTQDNNRLIGTIETQKQQLNEIRNDQFETTQGEVRYVVRGGNVVTINLGSADALRPNVTFGVIDADDIRLKDAKVKATIQVTQIQGPHLALARVIATPEIKNPIIPGDKVYSPFWAPGRRVKIALAGDIDIDGDGRPDNEAMKGQIKAAGAEVVAEVSSSGVKTGTMDASIRFLVVGDDLEVSDGSDVAGDNRDAVAAIGKAKAEAIELGITTIPAWKLQSYLKTINDTLTTPLGSAVRGDDFPPEPMKGRPRLPTDISEMYKEQLEGMQKGNEILP